MESEIVVVELASEARLRINEQIGSRMEQTGYGRYRFDKLNLGFELAPGWPVDINAQPTLAQLTVVAHKLGMRIVIGDVNLMPIGSTEAGEEAEVAKR